MNHREELFWKYAEGICTDSELDYIAKNEYDSAFKKELLLVKNLHKGLSDMDLTSAPDDLISLTMSSLVHSKQKIQIAPLSYRPLIVFIFFLFSVAVSFFFFTPSISISTPSPLLDIVAKYIPSFKFTIPSFPAVGNYILLLLVVPMIAAIDLFLSDGKYFHHISHKR